MFNPVGAVNDSYFHGVGNMTNFFGNQAEKNLDSFGLVSLNDYQSIMATTPVSLILSGENYSIFMIKGLEKEGFFLGKGILKYFKYETLMENVDLSKSRQFNRCIACCLDYVILEMEDEELYVFYTYEQLLIPFEMKKKVKLIGFNPNSHVISVYFTDHTLAITYLRANQLELKLRDIPLLNNSPIKLLTKYQHDFHILVHEDNSMYVQCTDTTKDNCGFTGEKQGLSKIDTDIFQCPIKQIVAGYSHLIVLLENGKCYSRGLNNYGQVAGVVDWGSLNDFHPLFHDIEPVISVNCSSLSTSLETESKIIIIGEVYKKFKILEEYSYCKGMKSYWVHRKKYLDESISFGTCHGFIYRATFKKNVERTLLYYQNNLRNLTKYSSLGRNLSDISIL